ncbi:glycosyltransferase [Mariniflexile sp.]|uniref:glycosyltransferase n=1 Tax=Mariniflexile sp. TaxID=1979402 RepID=UPI00356A878B
MKKRILVAPLNWGLGHATRSIPIIKALILQNFEPVIASDGAALMLLKKEFPELCFFELPSYNITYTKNGKFLKFKLLLNSLNVANAIKAEREVTKRIVDKQGISGIISDNRLGVYSNKVPSVYVTHQLKVLSGNTTWISTKAHRKFIQNFDVCWVPDVEGPINLSGQLGHPKTYKIATKYIGPLSRFEKKTTTTLNTLLVVLSGPEPQRKLLENKLLAELKHYSGSIIFIKGIMEQEQTKQVSNNITIYNFMTSAQLEKTINESDLVICRSGYTTIMDLAKLNKKAFFIPTPGQFEQEYLAKRLTELKLAPSCKQDEFSIDQLKKTADFEGLQSLDFETDFKTLFSLF